MTDFTKDRFLNHIAHVDEDLRMMALFDLQQYLNAAGGAPVAIDPVIVQKTLGCLAAEERKAGVRQEAVTTIPLLATACAAGEQAAILTMLLSSTTCLPSSPEAHPSSLELQDLCSLTLKATVTALVNASQRDPAYWQRTINTMEAYAKQSHNALENCTDLAARDAVYCTLNTIIPVFGNALERKTVDSVMVRGMKDVESVSALHRVTIPCCCALAPFTREAVLTKIQDNLVAALSKPGDEGYGAHLQLFESLLRSDPGRMQKCVGLVASNLVEALKKARDTYESVPEVAVTIARILEVSFSVLPPPVLPPAVVAETLSACAELAVFDPGCSGGQTEEPYQDEYSYTDDYYQDEYYGESTDMTWKLRVGALRVLTALVLSNTDASAGARALKTGTAALQDRIEDAQIAAFSLIATVATRPYFQAVQLRGDTFDALTAWAANGGDNSSLAALKTIDTIFRSVTDVAIVLGESAAKCLAAVLRDKEAITHNVHYAEEVVQTSKSMLEAFIVADAHNSQLLTLPDVVHFVHALIAVWRTNSGPASARVLQGLIKCNTLFLNVATRNSSSAEGGDLARSVVNMLAGVSSSPSADRDCRGASFSALSAWAALPAFNDAAKSALTAISAGLSDLSLRLDALRCLGGFQRQEDLRERIPGDLFQRLLEIVTGADNKDATRQLAADAATGFVKTGYPLPPRDWPTWLRVTEEIVNRVQIAGPSCADSDCFGLHAAVLRLMAACVTQQGSKERASQVQKAVVEPSWKCAAGHSGENGSYMDVLHGLVQLATAMSAAGSDFNVTESVAWFLTHSKAPSQKTYVMAGAGVCGTTSVDAASAFLNMLKKSKVDDASFLLFIGEVGRTAPLSQAYAELLLHSVQDDSAELIRANGETALAAAMPNTQNATMSAECVQRAVSTSPMKGRFYYLKALLTAIAVTQTNTNTNFSTLPQCTAVVIALLAQPAAEGFADQTAACIGAVAHRYPAMCVEKVAAALATGKKELRLLCATAIRFILRAVVAHGEDTSSIEAIVMNDLCNDLALTASPSIPIKAALLRLLAGQPGWLHNRPKVFQHLLTELRENDKLLSCINIGGYTHRTDKGIEMRKTAFECLAAVMESDWTRGTHLVEESGLASKLLDALIHASGSAMNGEKEASINNEAKLLLARFFHQYPRQEPTTEQLSSLCDKFKGDFESAPAGGANAGKADTLLTYTIHVILRLSRQPLFFHDEAFNNLLHRAQRSPLLAAALKMVPVA